MSPESLDESCRDRYLELLKGVLTRTVFDEVSTPVQPSRPLQKAMLGAAKRMFLDRARLSLVRTETVSRDRRTEGLDHPVDAETMVGVKRLDNLQMCVETALREAVAGDVLEAGVWRGGSAIFMQAVLKAWGATDRRVWVCDSFAGLPPPNPDAYPADAGDRHFENEFLAVSEQQVRRNFERYDLLDDNVVFVPGFFQDTLPPQGLEQLAVLRADGDMYESTIEILNELYPMVAPGGFVIIDDYGAIAACRAAVDDYRREHGITAHIETIDWTGVWWRKER